METKVVKEKVKKPVNIFIAEADNTPEAALRIYDKEKDLQHKYYYSTRLGSVKRVKGGYAIEFNEDHLPLVIGKPYELVVLGAKRKVIEGVIKTESQDEKRETKEEK